MIVLVLFLFTALPGYYVQAFCTSVPHLVVVPCDSMAFLLICYKPRHDLNFSQQAESVVATCNQRLYLLAQLKKGLGISAIDSVFKAVVLKKFLLCFANLLRIYD